MLYKLLLLILGVFISLFDDSDSDSGSSDSSDSGDSSDSDSDSGDSAGNDNESGGKGDAGQKTAAALRKGRRRGKPADLQDIPDNDVDLD